MQTLPSCLVGLTCLRDFASNKRTRSFENRLGMRTGEMALAVANKHATIRSRRQASPTCRLISYSKIYTMRPKFEKPLVSAQAAGRRMTESCAPSPGRANHFKVRVQNDVRRSSPATSSRTSLTQLRPTLSEQRIAPQEPNGISNSATEAGRINNLAPSMPSWDCLYLLAMRNSHDTPYS